MNFATDLRAFREAHAICREKAAQEPELTGVVSISNAMHELVDLVERAEDIPAMDRDELLTYLGQVRQSWPYNALVRERSNATGEPVDA